jgi:hypothetical protein
MPNPPGCLVTWHEGDAINACFDEEAQHMGENGACQPNVAIPIQLDQSAKKLDQQVMRVFDYAGAMLRSLASAAKVVEIIRELYDEHLRKHRLQPGFSVEPGPAGDGTSSYQGFPYRHPFVTLHEVVHDGNDAQLSEGHLMTPQMLIDVMAGLGRSVPVEILPERILVRTAEMIVWWSPASERTMFFSDRGEDPLLKKMNGKRYPQPALLFKACGTNLWIRALDQ